jgi:GAF domain-containing protein
VHPHVHRPAEISGTWEQVTVERRRAAGAAVIAAIHAAQESAVPEKAHPLHGRMAELHRQAEARHIAAARIAGWEAARCGLTDDASGAAPGPVFMAGVAAVLGTPSAAVTLYGQRHREMVSATSDATARAAHNLELVLAEGPVTEVTACGEPIVAGGDAVERRWPLYGPAVARLGVRAVVAAPLASGTAHFGVLCAYDQVPDVSAVAVRAVQEVAGAVVDLLASALATAYDEALRDVPLLAECDGMAVVHQAAGIVSVCCNCGIDDAADLLAARAFAEDASVEDIARRVLRGDVRISL